MVEHGKAYPKNEDQYLAFSFFLQKPTSTRSPCLIHTQNHAIQNLPFFYDDLLLFFFFFKHNDLYNENEG